MADKLRTVAFVGAGDATAENIAHLLDDWFTGECAPPIVPAGISRKHKGLNLTADWLNSEFKPQNVDIVEQTKIITALCEGRDAGTADAYLVYIPAEEDDPYEPFVKHALDEGIPVLDLTQGLYPYALPAPEPEPEPEPEVKPRRGRPRAAAAQEEKPSKMDELNFQRQAEAKPGLDFTRLADTIAKEKEIEASMADPTPPWSPPKASVELSQSTIDLCLQALAALAGDIASSVKDAPKPPKTQPYWVDEDGNYRPREGKGRGRKGETAVDLTPGEIDELGLS